ncbi:hypothetical protein C2S52_022267 [Perilla frutescens var. hirtella]|nr:hypothetical protein C2S52_022267 [Perilla frutescens var. hirtella]
MSSKHGLDSDRFGYLDLEDEVEKLGFVSWGSLSYKVPQTMIYKVLRDDKDVMQMLSYISQKCRVLSVYVDNGKKSGEISAVLTKFVGGDGTEELTNLNGNVEDANEKSVGVKGDESEDCEVWNSEEDDDYIPSIGYNDDLSDIELASDDEGQAWQIENEAQNDGFVSEYEDSDSDVNSDSTNDEADDNKRRKKMITYDPRCDHKSLKLFLGMRFEDGIQCREALRNVSIENGYPIHFRRVSKYQCEAICTAPCTWRCYGSLIKRDSTFSIKVINGEHTCPRAIHNTQVTSNWICKKYLNTFRLRPNMTAKELEANIMEKYACQVTKWRCYNGIWKARAELGGSVEDHYAQISTHLEAYKVALEDMKAENQQAYEDFIERGPNKFCKAFISTSPNCDNIDNNMSETFNRYIVTTRSKHVVDMLQDIRCALMERQYKKLTAVSSLNDRICPNIRAKLEKLKYESRLGITHPAVGGIFEVKLHEMRYVVTLGSKSCTCRVWDLTGIPCVHACSAIHYMKLDPPDFVDECYMIPKYLEAYRYGLPPLNGPDMWEEATGFPVKPPIIRKMLGRPKQKRKRDADEKSSTNPNKLKRQVVMTCQRCLQTGHNTRGCRNEAVEKPETVKGKRGRPRKHDTSGMSQSAVMKNKQQASTSRQASKVVIAKERALANKGLGVLVCEGTGHIYTRMPNEKRAYFVNPTQHGRQAATSLGAASGSGSTSIHMPTQESQT